MFDAGTKPDFLPETASIRDADWSVQPAPADLIDRRVEITGPAERKMIVNALNSGAQVFMADFEDSGKDLAYTDAETRERYVPYVIETSIGVDRCMLALLSNAFDEDEVGGDKRVVLRLAPHVAPNQAAVLPLSKKLAEPAQRVAAQLRKRWSVAFDVSGSIGRRYRRQDEIGTPFCVTYDFDSEQDGKATVRERDSMAQERVALDALAGYLEERISGP